MQYSGTGRTPVSSRESFRPGGGTMGVNPGQYGPTSPPGQGQGGRGYYTSFGVPVTSPSTPPPQVQRLDQTYVRQPSSRVSVGTPSPSGVGGLNTSQSLQGSGMPEQDVIDHASRTMDRLMNKDLQFPGLYKYLTTDPTQTVTGTRPVSGFMDYDYPPFIQQRVITEKQFTKMYSAPIPRELNEMLSQADIKYCHMGLFPEINRAWMTIDSDIYLWDYRDGSDLSFFDGLTEPIMMIQLVPAKTQVFQSSIDHLLCVTTQSEVVILGFVMSDSGTENGPVIELVPQPIFVVPTEGLVFGVIHGTKTGRIFLGGQDGSIHEINYQAQKGWMTDRCWKTNLTRSYFSTFFKFISTSAATDSIVEIVSDNFRNLLFTRSSSGCLQVFDLGQDGTGFSRVSYLPFDGIVNEIVTISKKTLEGNMVKKILTIAPLTSGEMNLVAVLDNGARLYFSCYNPPISSLRAPTQFHLVHVRMPPGYCPATVMPKPSTAHAAFSCSGLFALASKTAQDNDSFWLISPFMYPAQHYSEVFAVLNLSGQVMDIKLIPSSDPQLSITGLDQLPDVISQHLNWHRDIVVLTTNGSTVYRALKPYEILRELLLDLGPTDNLRSHFETGTSKEQPLANALLLSIHPSTRSEPSVYDMAMKAFFIHGSETGRGWAEGRISSPFDSTMDFNPNLVSTPQAQAQSPYASPVGSRFESGYISPQGQPNAGGVQSGTPTPYGTPSAIQQGQDALMLSFRHDAIYLVAGRILFHFWNRPLVNTGTVGNGAPPIITPNVKGQEVTHAITFIRNVVKFISNNPSLYMSRNISAAILTLNTPEARQLYAQEMEKNSILALKDFLLLTLEVLNMWKILCDHQFHIVLHGVDNQLQNSTMRDLVTTGHSTVSIIINALISRYLGDNAAVDAISLRLREVCPSLFKSEDAIGSKVAEILSKVKNCSDRHERELMLKESLVLAEKICGHGRVNIRSLCKQYSDLGFPVGAVRLCASAAKAADPDKLALDTVRAGSPTSDPIGMQAFQTRAEIYRIVFDALDSYVRMASANQSPLLRDAEDRLPPPAAQLCAEETIHAILTSDDEIFHISLYNWLLEKKQFDRLLEIKHPYLDSFLQRAADAVVSGKWPGGGISANDTRVLDLLWRHHEMNQNHVAAAHILSKLAESTTTGLSLSQRLEYLSRSVVCTKASSQRSDILSTLEDKVEVAQIQKRILDSINGRINAIMQTPGAEDDAEVKLFQEAALKLNSQLLNITQLYSDFAHPLKLNEAKLEIFYTASHGDKSAIETLWSDIIEDELAANANRSSESQMEVIRRKVVGLGRRYKTSPTFFPTEYLIEHLELMKPDDTENVTWAFQTMLEVGVSFSDLLTIYEGLWKRAIGRPTTPAGDIPLAKVIMLMLDSATKQEVNIRSTFLHRPDLLEKCKDLVSVMIVEFSSRFDPSSTEMVHCFNRIRDRLDRIGMYM